ncbi:heparan-alpha-glucosaminide N-acetyltransferase-like [Macrosteles quadrilineatus]|uniref:heparan-alpha-glucosaminide N-acetyltransferase-like n=1 Tax=Macrosteles quadrilineatus TaxID=74068 RepID=UPI0023E15EF0|nr:heparan-alpha-glucosaminide N-acetyltransferase-like [Macrosteles quadrilineatus]
MDTSRNCPSNLSSLNYDTACLLITNQLEENVDIYTLSSDCYQCDPQLWSSVPLTSTLSFVTPAVKPLTLYAVGKVSNESICNQTVLLNQHELLSWKIGTNCTFTVEDEGENAYLALEVAIYGLTALMLLYVLIRSACRTQWIQNIFSRDATIIDMRNDLGNPSSSDDSLLIQSELVPLRRLSSPRIQALDTFRGFTIALMIFVNYGGGKFWFFEHSAWNGLTIADVVYPWFAWVMGVSLVISYRSKLRSCVSRTHVFYVSLRRAAVLIALGLILNTHNDNDLHTMRFCGVLQRLGVAHLVVSTLETIFMKKQPSLQYGRWLSFSELVDTWRQWIVILTLMGVHLYFTMFHPVPGCPTGYIGPGGLGDHGAYPNCTGGAARYIDSQVFGDAHLYPRGPVKRVYHTNVPFDPEGILGTLTTCLTVYLGVQAGYIILSYNSTVSRSLRWLFWALITGLFAGFLCGWSVEGGLIPVNKQLWSVSYALLTSSFAFLVFTLAFLLIDHCRWCTGGMFKSAGMNAILLYTGHILLKHTFPWSWKPSDVTNHGELLSMNVNGVFAWLLVAWVLERYQIFVSI